MKNAKLVRNSFIGLGFLILMGLGMRYGHGRLYPLFALIAVVIALLPWQKLK